MDEIAEGVPAGGGGVGGGDLLLLQMGEPVLFELGESGDGVGGFFGRWMAGDGAEIDVVDLASGVVGELIEQAAGEVAGVFEDDGAVAHFQGLGGDGGVGTFGAVGRHGGEVEGFEEGDRGGAALEEIDGAAPLVAGGPFDDFAAGAGFDGDGGAEAFRGEAGGGEELVAGGEEGGLGRWRGAWNRGAVRRPYGGGACGRGACFRGRRRGPVGLGWRTGGRPWTSS